MSRTLTECDFLLLAPWTEPVHVAPDYELIRSELARHTSNLAREKVEHHLSNMRRPPAFCDVNSYWDQFHYSHLFPFCPGLLSIAAALEQVGAKVRCVSLDVERLNANGRPDWLRACLQRLVRDTNLAVGITSVTPEFSRAISALSAIRSLRPDLVTVIGGTHVTYLDDLAAKDPSVDIVVRGEGETPIVDLYERLCQGRDIDDIPGTTNALHGSVRRNESASLIDLSTAPMPSYSLLDGQTRQRVKITPTFSRGCPFSCDYCVESSFWNRRVRHKDPQMFVEELRYISDVLGWRFIHIADSTFGIVPSALDAFCDALEQAPVDALFSINVRPDVVSYMGEERIARLLRLGFVEWYMGAETTDDDLLTALHRKQSTEGLLSTLYQLKEIGIPMVKLYLMIGIPGDTHEGLQQTINVVRMLVEQALILYATCKFFVPTPGTRYFDELKNGAPGLGGGDWSEYERYTFPPWYQHDELSPLELQQYLSLIQAVQLGVHVKNARTGQDVSVFGDDRLKPIRSWTKSHYLERVYM